MTSYQEIEKWENRAADLLTESDCVYREHAASNEHRDELNARALVLATMAHAYATLSHAAAYRKEQWERER